ncbi:MAG: F0F1 ATP synthase subunit B [Gammaproteobacteria bacterium]|nr:F0F1 ATP synthase subunit B [Gammaproteobacteria bacterium]
MNINLTLIGQSITFAIFVWFCYAYVWPPLVAALAERQKKIADGLAAAERGQHEQELAKKKAVEHLKEAKGKASDIITQAQKRANEIVDEAKDDARTEAERIKAGANAEIEQEVNRAREHLRQEVVTLAISGAEKILKREVDKAAHASSLNDLAAQL